MESSVSNAPNVNVESVKWTNADLQEIIASALIVGDKKFIKVACRDIVSPILNTLSFPSYKVLLIYPIEGVVSVNALYAFNLPLPSFSA